MKFCKPRTYEYAGINGVPTETKYITHADMQQFHGVEFARQWQQFAKHLKLATFGHDTGYYYFDYKHVAMTTKQWLDS